MMVASSVVDWLGDNRSAIADWASVALTALLTAVTARYAWITHGMLRVESERWELDKQEREVQYKTSLCAQLRLRAEQVSRSGSAPFVALTVANVGLHAATDVQIVIRESDARFFDPNGQPDIEWVIGSIFTNDSATRILEGASPSNTIEMHVLWCDGREPRNGCDYKVFVT